MDLRCHSFSTNTPDEFTIDIVNAMNRQLRPPSAVNRQIFHRIHGAFARAERRLMTTPDERPQNITPMPISGDPSSSMHGLLPQTKAPIEFKCSICLESIKKGDVSINGYERILEMLVVLHVEHLCIIHL
jgi:hypothetical protein